MSVVFTAICGALGIVAKLEKGDTQILRNWIEIQKKNMFYLNLFDMGFFYSFSFRIKIYYS